MNSEELILNRNLLINYSNDVIYVDSRKKINRCMQDYLKSHLPIYYFYLTHDLFDDHHIFHRNMQNNAIKIYLNYLNKKYRCKKVIKKLFKLYPNELYFLTLTFNDEYLTIKQKEILKIFKEYIYIANEDFGDLNHRRHYHFIFVSPYKALKLTYNLIFSLWPYGFIYVEKINSSLNLSVNSLACYLTKLSSHCLKGTTNKHVIYHLIKEF